VEIQLLVWHFVTDILNVIIKAEIIKASCIQGNILKEFYDNESSLNSQSWIFTATMTILNGVGIGAFPNDKQQFRQHTTWFLS